MPWGKPHKFTCVEPGCEKEFYSTAINVARCPDCRPIHNKRRILARYRELRGELYGTRPEHNQPLSDVARFNLFMAKTWRYAKCPECKQHMTSCKCCEPVVRHVSPVQVATFDPLAMPVPEVCSDRETWEPWK